MTYELSRYDLAYIDRHISEFDEFTDMDDWSPAFRAEVEARQGKVTHRSRCRIKSNDYDWRKLDAQMRQHRLSNETMVVL